HLRTLSGADGLAHGSAWLTETWPPLAKLVSRPAAARRSITQTDLPCFSAKYALLMPTTPAPRTTTSYCFGRVFISDLEVAHRRRVAPARAPSVIGLRVSPVLIFPRT